MQRSLDDPVEYPKDGWKCKAPNCLKPTLPWEPFCKEHRKNPPKAIDPKPQPPERKEDDLPF
jgi:hypothetical protein